MSGPWHAISLYLDTSVIGGYYDTVFKGDTRKLWRLREAGHFRFFTSQLVFQEAAGAPDGVQELMRATFRPNDVLELTREAEELAAVYLARKVVPTKFDDDARHVAICTASRIGHLVSWNFKHLANARREAGFNAVNLLHGYPAVRIVAPTFLIHGHE